MGNEVHAAGQNRHREIALRQPPGEAVDQIGRQDIQDNVDGHEEAGMVPHQHHLEIGGDPVDRPEAGGGANGEGELPEGLLPVAGPHIEVVHVQTLDADVAVDVEAHKAEEQQRKHRLPAVYPFVSVSCIHDYTLLLLLPTAEALSALRDSPSPALPLPEALPRCSRHS